MDLRKIVDFFHSVFSFKKSRMLTFKIFMCQSVTVISKLILTKVYFALFLYMNHLLGLVWFCFALMSYIFVENWAFKIIECENQWTSDSSSSLGFAFPADFCSC